MLPRLLLIVDDDEDDRQFFLEAIAAVTPETACIEAENGQSAFRRLLGQQPLPEIIFLDLNMPLMSGTQFLEELKKHSKLSSIPVVILSTSADKNSKRETERLGAIHFITKPDKLSVWESTLRNFLDSFSNR